MSDIEKYLGVGSTGAYLSECRTYRYTLWRRWESDCPPERMALFIGLNPSTADETVDDPTIRRCIGFAKSWNCGGFVMTNLFALRATDPGEMKRSEDPWGGLDCLESIRSLAAVCSPVIGCWGNHGAHMERGAEVLSHLILDGVTVECLGLNKSGHPKHPLYLPGDAPRQNFKGEVIS